MTWSSCATRRTPPNSAARTVQALDQIRKAATFRGQSSQRAKRGAPALAKTSRIWSTGYYADPTRMIWWTARNMIQPFVFMPGQVPDHHAARVPGKAAIKGEELPADFHKFMGTTFENMVNQRMARHAPGQRTRPRCTGLGQSRWNGHELVIEAIIMAELAKVIGELVHP